MKYFLIFLGIPFLLSAQQLYLFSQLHASSVFFNPSLAGSQPELLVCLLNKQQAGKEDWVPKTTGITFSMPANYYRLGLGAKIIQDSYFGLNTFSAQALISYKIRCAKGFLSFGMSPGWKQFGYDAGAINPKHLSDPDFVALQQSWSKFDIGAGVSYFDSKWLMGSSFQKVLGFPEHLKIASSYYYLGHVSRIFSLNQAYGLRVSAQVRGIKANYLAEASAAIQHRLGWLGAGTRSNSDVFLLAGIDLHGAIPALRFPVSIMYAFDVSYSNHVLSARPRHELGLVFRFKKTKHSDSVLPSGNHLRIL
ncbi:MAG: PorP/SprF family type IX secretion system membrane protein [Cytophagaceae bacterium]|jgi:type IX secretion system PorP/SprF family membrane protein|nr:PorP/SprF family type IX secretion system membrane protein [Cytophagaceae bacterium]